MIQRQFTAAGRIHEDIDVLLAATLEADPRLQSHLEETQAVALQMIDPFGFRGADARTFVIAAYLHDIGKMLLPPSVLWKPGRLTDLEWQVIRAHPGFGARLVGPSDPRVARVVAQHHERMDGAGYPTGLKGDAIDPLARALAVVDAYVVMTHDRVYQPKRSAGEALEELKRCSGTQFDPSFASAFVEAAEDL